MSLSTIPAPSDSVEVRRRQWVVREVVASGLPADPTKPETSHATHLVRLLSMEEDAWGEELEVIWELEPGRRIVHGAGGGLPEPKRFDAPEDLDAFLDAVRWGAISSADSSALQSPFRSGISIEEYQLDPVVRAVRMPRVNLLVADDVGLGKTIEAGLVVQELLLRHRIRRVLIVCPASLQLKWQGEMREKFGLEFHVVDSQQMRDLRRMRGLHVNPWTHFPRLITSMDYLKREGPMRLFRETLPRQGEPTYPRRYDLLIVDEAHNVAPTGNGKYPIDSQRTTAIRTIAPHFEHKLFLTATPHNGYSESFSALLNLLDDQRFARGVRELDPKQVQSVMVRRLKTELEDEHGRPLFPKRELVPVQVSYTEDEKAAYAKLIEYGELRKASSKAGGESGRMATDFVLKLLKKRLFSSPQAFLRTLEEHEKTLRGLRDEREGKRVRPTPGILRRQIEEAEVDASDDEEYESGLDSALNAATNAFEHLEEREKTLLRELKDWARIASPRPDSKAKRLLEWIEDNLHPGRRWNDERVVIFTEYRDTQKWLQGILATEGLASDGRLELLYGGMDEKDRERIKNAFQAHPSESKVRILLATDMASEGIDLQNHCRYLFHVEIPWNPNVLEQRNGRIDRHGQSRTPLIHHFVGSSYRERAFSDDLKPGDLEGDLEFLMVAARKIEQIGRDLLGKVSPVVAHQVEEAMLGRRRRLDTVAAEKEGEVDRKILTFQRRLRDEIVKLKERLSDSRRELHVTPDSVRRVVDLALRLANQPPLEVTRLPGAPTDSGSEPRVFRLPRLRDPWHLCAIGLPHPHSQEIRPITFDQEVAKGNDKVVLVHLNHPLVRMAQQHLRSEVFASEGSRSIHRISASVVSRTVTEDLVALVWGRILVLGADGHRLHEEILCAGGRIRAGRFRRLETVKETDNLAEVSGNASAPEDAQRRIAALWPEVGPSLQGALEAREKERTKNLGTTLSRLADEECSKLEQVFRELQQQIEGELASRVNVQLDYTEPEKLQWTLDSQSLREELERIPGKKAAELANLRRRFESPKSWLFPIAVRFLVPEGWSGG